MKAGIAGHQDLGPAETVEWLIDNVAAIVSERGVTMGFTSLAVGADQLYATVLMEHGIPYVAVIPCQHYEATFGRKDDLHRYRELLRGACDSVHLGFPKPEEIAFLEAGKRVVALSDIMICIWNGKQARGLGGTGDIVQYAISCGKRVIHLNPLTHEIVQL